MKVEINCNNDEVKAYMAACGVCPRGRLAVSCTLYCSRFPYYIKTVMLTLYKIFEEIFMNIMLTDQFYSHAFFILPRTKVFINAPVFGPALEVHLRLHEGRLLLWSLFTLFLCV